MIKTLDYVGRFFKWKVESGKWQISVCGNAPNGMCKSIAKLIPLFLRM